MEATDRLVEKLNQLDRADGDDDPDAAPAAAGEPRPRPPLAPRAAPKVIQLELPVAVGGPGYRARKVDLRLTARQAHALRCLYDGCSDVRLENGRRVATANDAVRYVLERLAAAALDGQAAA